MQTAIFEIGAQADIGAWISGVSGVGGALLGALVGGQISSRIQRKEHERADVLRSVDLLTRQRSTAYVMLVKLIEITSDMKRIEHHILSQQQGIAPGTDPWSYFLPLYVPSDQMEWARDEVALLLDLQLHDEFNAVGSLPAIRNQVHSTMLSYTTKREQLWAMLPESAFAFGQVQLTPGQLFWTERLRTELSDLLDYMASSVPRSAAEASSGLEKLHAAFKERLDLKFKIEIDETSLAA